jgi:TonB family protein
VPSAQRSPEATPTRRTVTIAKEEPQPNPTANEVQKSPLSSAAQVDLPLESCGQVARVQTAKGDSCEPYRERYDELGIGDHWTKISQIFGSPTSMEDTAGGDTIYVYRLADCTLSFCARFDNRLAAKQANPSFSAERQQSSAPAVQNSQLSPTAVVELTIDSVPDGAAVQFNGRSLGKTPVPLTFSIDPGAPEIIIEKPGFVTWAGHIVLTPGQPVTLKPQLKPNGYVVLASSESGVANVPIDPARVGNGVSAPVVLYKIDPSYSDEARALKVWGSVVLRLIVDTNGQPRDIQILRSLAFGLDEKAAEAINSWKFRPGYRDGKPVAVMATIEVNFRLL